MRNFGSKIPKYMEFTLFEEDEVYKVPLIGSMKPKEILHMQKDMKAIGKTEESQLEYELDFFRKYIGDAVDELSMSDLGELWQAWLKESSSNGATVGESSASSET
jgi:hypothetical protein